MTTVGSNLNERRLAKRSATKFICEAESKIARHG
uniref:Uncharacterized protein n=1 Tax=Anopheles minimus TaxID=112268 RepID=A0A182WNV5_9DIPT